MKYTFRFITFLVLLVCVSSLSAQSKTLKFGHINSQQLLTEMPEFELALKQMEKMQTDGNEKLKIMQAELQKQVENYQKGAAILSMEARAAKEKELGEMQQKIQAYYQETQQLMQSKEAELTQPIIEKARKAVEELGKENGFLYIFDTAKGELIHIGVQSVDIMPLARKKLGIVSTPGKTIPSAQ